MVAGEDGKRISRFCLCCWRDVDAWAHLQESQIKTPFFDHEPDFVLRRIF